MSRTLRSSLKLPRMHRGSAITVILVALMFLSALLWVREQHNQGTAPLRAHGTHAQA